MLTSGSDVILMKVCEGVDVEGNIQKRFPAPCRQTIPAALKHNTLREYERCVLLGGDRNIECI